MAQKHFPRGLDDRMRDKNAEIRKKRDDTLIGTLRKEYGENFARPYRSDAKLATVLKEEGVDSLDKLKKIAYDIAKKRAETSQLNDQGTQSQKRSESAPGQNKTGFGVERWQPKDDPPDKKN